MSPEPCVIQEGALFIADAHYAPYRPALLAFLRTILEGPHYPPQIFLMGDMFDLLVGHVSYLCTYNHDLISLLEALGECCEVIYLEGNHDFALDKLFVHLRVIPLGAQPLACTLRERPVPLAHGDLYCGRGYAWYTALIRNRFMLKLLGGLDGLLAGRISRKLLAHLAGKQICRTVEDFYIIAKERVARYGALKNTLILEGHHHQNRQYEFGSVTYLNLPSFACSESFFIVQSKSGNLIFERNVAP